ncbi:cold shock domain-containing protein 3 [Salmo salar]|uniref:Cold shock domain-containing protein 3 n=1 Tax=Salmo salar TaxID=8030 RepID=A0ABM3DW09_SALSA|nr:cold shock domain-containing protein 3-like [Salmo salar]
MSIRLDNLLAARGRPDGALLVPPPGPPAPIPMELGGAASRGTGGGGSPCIQCGQRGHTTDRCWGSSSGNRDGRRSTPHPSQAGGGWSHAGR